MPPTPKSQLSIIVSIIALALSACATDDDPISREDIVVPLDPNSVSVHDPMVIKDGGWYYIFGSHLAAAKSQDLIHWKSIAGDWNPENPIIPNPDEELKEAMLWPEPDAESTWAKSPILLNGVYHLYFSAAHWHSPRSNISLATSDRVEGPYSYQGMLIRKYENGEHSEEIDAPFDDSIHPGVIDPHVFFDVDDQLWMVYGSYSGGMHILRMDPETGRPFEGQGYGKRIAGGNHAPMEGPYILYNPDTRFYYLLVSFGTLGPDGGYNIRVARSENPDGPYVDPMGNSMTEFIDKDINGRNWRNSEPYGAKLIGNFLFTESNLGYLAPGHNSALYDEELDKTFAIFHTRFPGQGGIHQVRVHQLFMNSEGWYVMAPHNYNGERIGSYEDSELIGRYQYVNHGREIQATFGTPGGNIILSSDIELLADGRIRGDVEGSWERVNEHQAVIQIDGATYHGVFLKQWDRGLEKEVMTFSALSDEGIAVWGSQVP
ncbi:MAG: glycoside hydrolase family 43 protein [Opitutales bacterium]|nr:glycoside hydrolase family 43 protein [Opitutales bacterium]